MLRFPCRCNVCRKRKTLKNHPDWYIKPKKCSCGGILKVDSYRKTIENKKSKCTCDGYHFPHKYKSKWCNHNTSLKTIEDLNERSGTQYDDLLGTIKQTMTAKESCPF